MDEHNQQDRQVAVEEDHINPVMMGHENETTGGVLWLNSEEGDDGWDEYSWSWEEDKKTRIMKTKQHWGSHDQQGQ